MNNRDVNCVTPDQCTGCGACKDICPRQAIVFRDDAEGFPSPWIEVDRCVHCGLCEKACPALHPPQKHTILEAYAAQIKDREALKASTSGGVFTELSREILKNHGVVFGCIWDEAYNAVIVKAESEAEIIPMRGSKYVWSNASDAYPQVREALETGNPVLFTGTPCQVSGLRNYLQRDWPNLYTLDFLCGGAPSPMAFQAYLKTITHSIPLNRLDLKFRDKEKYGVGIHITYQGPKKRVYQTYDENPYFFSYVIKAVHRLPCYHCQYGYNERVSDFTMGDYWGVEDYHTEFDIKAGVSILLVNTEKGKKMVDAVKERMQLVPTKIEDIAVQNHLNINGKKHNRHTKPYRKEFLDLCAKGEWEKAERKYLDKDVGRIRVLIKKKIKSPFLYRVWRKMRQKI